MVSKRLEAIAKMIPPYHHIADVGCDHGYLIIEAIQKYDVTKAIAIDNKEGPLYASQNNIKKNNLEKYVRFSLSDGISDIDNDTEAVIIAGMGGQLIIKILSNSEKLTNIKRLIVQPNRNTYEVRKFLMENQFKIVDEDVIKDGNKFYEIILAEKGQNFTYTEDELQFGPVNLQKMSNDFKEKIKVDIIHLKGLSKDISKIEEKIEKMEKILCM